MRFKKQDKRGDDGCSKRTCTVNGRREAQQQKGHGPCRDRAIEYAGGDNHGVLEMHKRNT